MRLTPLLLLLATSALEPPRAGADPQSHQVDTRRTSSSELLSQISTMLSMRQVSMQVVDQSPVEDDSDHRVISSFNIDRKNLADNSVSDLIVEVIAKEMESAGVTPEDLAKYIDQQIKNKTSDPGTTEQPAVEEEGEADEGEDQKMDEEDEEAESKDKVDETAEEKDGQSMGSARYPKQLRAENPSSRSDLSDPSSPASPSDPASQSDSTGPSDHAIPSNPAIPPSPSSPANPSGPSYPSSGGPDVFNNGTDFFKWLDEIIQRVSDRMAKNGSTMDDIAVNERPGQMDGKSTRQQPTERRPIERQGRPERSDAEDKKADKTSRTSGATDVKDWMNSEIAHGGFDNIPKAVPMIVMSGNTYIKDIGNFRNSYQYGALPLRVRTIEPNGNDSGLDLDEEKKKTEDGRQDGRTLERGIRDGNTRRRDHLETAIRDGNTRSGNHLLRSTARGNAVHGHDDGDTRGDTGDSRKKQSEEDSSGYHSSVHGHDDGDSRGDSGGNQDEEDSSAYHSSVHGHDDGDSPGGYHSSVHGHDDGDSSGDSRRLLRAGRSGVHGHDDGGSRSKGSGSIHGHDDGGSRSRGSGSSHGHDDGGSRRGNGGSGLVHGHDDGSLLQATQKVHGHDDGGTWSGDSSSVHGHDDGSTWSGDSSSVHGHDDGGTWSGDSSSVHGHDDGGTRSGDSSSVHGHDDGGTWSGESSSVHGHDDGGTRSGDSSSVHGHDDGGTWSGESSSVHGHDDGGLLRATQEGRTTQMTMSHVSLTVFGTALVVLAVAAFVTARRQRVGVFRRTDYIAV